MRKLRSISYVAVLAIAGLLAVLINPLVVMSISISLLAILAIARQINFYKIVMMMKNYVKTVAKLRFEIRAKLHTGFRDYSSSADAEEAHHRGNCGYVR